MKPPKFHPIKCQDPIATLTQLLKQESFRLNGFPLALQLIAYQAVPKLLSTIPIPADDLSIMDLVEPHFPYYPAPSINDILSVEWDPEVSVTSPFCFISDIYYSFGCDVLFVSTCNYQLKVTSLIPIQSQPEPGWGVWDTVSKDGMVTYMEQLIADHKPFGKHLWYGGDTSEPLYNPEPSSSEEDVPIIEVKMPKKQISRKKVTNSRAPPKVACKTRKTSKKASTARKQRRISSYFQAAASSTTAKDEIMELLNTIKDQVSILQKDSREMRKLLKRKKSSHCHKTFHTLNRQSKKPKKVSRGCQTEAIDVLTNETVTTAFLTKLIFLLFSIINGMTLLGFVVVSSSYGGRSHSQSIRGSAPPLSISQHTNYRDT